MNNKYYIVAGLAFVAVVLAGLGSGLPLYTISLDLSGSIKLEGHASMWRMCAKATSGSVVVEECKNLSPDEAGCDRAEKFVIATRAFEIITCLVIGVAMVCSVGRAAGLATFKQPVTEIVIILVSAAGFVTGLIDDSR